jgi:hypothetical protein
MQLGSIVPSTGPALGRHRHTTGFGRGRMRAPDKHRGAQTELLACTYLLGEGYDVFRNISAHGLVDIIACRGTELLRIDVKSGGSPKLKPAQERDGVVILHVDEHGVCEFDTDRKRRFAEVVGATLAEVTGIPPKEAAEQLNQRGITTPAGARWGAGTVAQLRQRYGLT